MNDISRSNGRSGDKDDGGAAAGGIIMTGTATSNSGSGGGGGGSGRSAVAALFRYVALATAAVVLTAACPGHTVLWKNEETSDDDEMTAAAAAAATTSSSVIVTVSRWHAAALVLVYAVTVAAYIRVQYSNPGYLSAEIMSNLDASLSERGELSLLGYEQRQQQQGQQEERQQERQEQEGLSLSATDTSATTTTPAAAATERPRTDDLVVYGPHPPRQVSSKQQQQPVAVEMTVPGMKKDNKVSLRPSSPTFTRRTTATTATTTTATTTAGDSAAAAAATTATFLSSSSRGITATTMTTTTATTTTTSTRRKACGACRFAPTLRAHHCRKCGRCVATFDHHCDFVNNCIGERNRCRFWWFLFCQWTGFVACCHVVGSSDFSLWKAAISPLFSSSSASSLSWRSCLVASLAKLYLYPLTALATVMLLVHTFLAVTNTTTFEWAKGSRHLEYLQGTQETDCPFSSGLATNLRQYGCCDISCRRFARDCRSSATERQQQQHWQRQPAWTPTVWQPPGKIVRDSEDWWQHPWQNKYWSCC